MCLMCVCFFFFFAFEKFAAAISEIEVPDHLIARWKSISALDSLE